MSQTSPTSCAPRLQTSKVTPRRSTDADDIDRATEKNFLGVIIGESDRMTHIVSDLLTLSRLDHDRGAKEFELADIAEIARKVCVAMELTAKERGHRLTLEASEPTGLVLCDRSRIEQVLVNIVSNAIKYTPGRRAR